MRVYQNSAIVGRGFGTDNPTVGEGNVVSGGSDATSILGVPITGTPADGDILQYNATANEWQIVGPLLKRQSIVKTTGSLANGSSESGNINPGCKSFILLSVTTDRSARVELYPTAAAQAADSGRAFGRPPEPLSENEVLTDVLLSAGGAETFICSTPLICSNMDGTPAEKIYYNITNNSGATSAVTVTLVIIPLEV
ncbi:Uncharacterised protein [uncultured archaeon]|nr:Uncharacterised protein [uncultured archaeon]